MRLTLRTMLACLDADDRLDPADAEELQQKIEQSKIASDLAQRIRRVVQHPRLGAPRLDGKGMGLDPNSIAEYLDNTLSSDRISEFERLCLHSDVELAEVAACHQILVLVLEQPAEIDPALRERMYRIGAEAARLQQDLQAADQVHRGANGKTAHYDQTAAAAAAATSATAAPAASEVPEYLRAGRRAPLWPLALAALLGFVLVAAGLRAMGPLDRNHPMAKLLLGSPRQVAQENGADAGTPRGGNTVVTPTEGLPDRDEPVDVEPPGELPGDVEVNRRTLPTETPVEPPVVAPMPDEELQEPPVPGDTSVPEPGDTAAITPPEPETEITPASPATEPPAPAADIGRYVSEDQVLVRWNPEARQWNRVPVRAPLFPGNELVVLPAYRPQVLLASGMQLTFAGESHVELQMNDSEGNAQLHVAYGRFLAVSVGKANARLGLNLAGVEGTVIFSEADSEVAIEVRSYLPPGANPETPTTVNVVRLFTTHGKIAWQEGHPDAPGETVPIESGHVHNYVGTEPGQTVAITSPPDWIDGKNIADIDRRAARDLEARLAGDRSLELTLAEMASEMERRAELRALAARALVQLGRFEPILATFGDESQRAYWAAEFDALRDAIARGPDDATAVREKLVEMHGAKIGGELYRMLWGYSQEQLNDPQVSAELVKWLDVESLRHRVLAFENLRRITGATLLYQPHFAAARRRGPVAQWSARQKSGEIVYKTPPAPIQDTRPVTPAPRATESEAPLLE